MCLGNTPTHVVMITFRGADAVSVVHGMLQANVQLRCRVLRGTGIYLHFFYDIVV